MLDMSGTLVFRIALMASIVMTGLFSGMTLAITLLFYPSVRKLSGPEFTSICHRFLRISDIGPANYTLIILSMLSPTIALVGGLNESESLPFTLTLAGWIVFLVGSVGVSRFLLEPLYDKFASWSDQSPPGNWESYRKRWYWFTQLQSFSSTCAFVLYIAALDQLFM
ncbi:MAG: hypothetical protein JXB30_20285 [Anaerolineae bacterium]|nr:hypothetical protein [Anaerolineae bacterium]